MGARAEVSEKNKWWLPRHRYYELKHFCLQYPAWKKILAKLQGVSIYPMDLEKVSRTNNIDDPTARCVMERSYYFERIELIEKTAKKACLELAEYVLKGVTEGLSYDVLNARIGVPCCRDTYYDLYRRFFWLMDKERG